MDKRFTLLGVLLCITICSAKVSFKRSLVVTTTTEAAQTNDKNDALSEPTIPRIYEMRVDTNVSNRYAKTVITSKVRNLNSKAQEATFSVVTPDKAFISGFTMEIGGKKYEAYVQEKEEAKQTYQQAVSSGQSAAHVAVSARDSNRFTVSVNIEPQSKATFYLTYEELLVRKNEKYEIVLNIHPGQPVKDLSVQVNIAESRPLKFVKAPSLRSGNEVSKNSPNLDPEAEIKTINETSAVVKFSPDVARQKLLASGLGGKEEDGLSGQFVVQYDVERDPQGGEVLVDGGYFVHFFAPEELPPLKKQVVFVLDTSGSMSGIRITQLKEAMDSILAELKPEDVFSIVEFNSVVRVWNVPLVKVTFTEGDDPYLFYSHTTEKPKEKVEQVLPPSFPATEENINKAKQVVKQFDANGGTDIQSALKIGLEIVSRNADPKSHQPIIVFLTDGEPTVGEFNTEKITSTITELNSNKVPIFSLSFGDGADRAFLQKISLKNQGFARHIYEAADAYLQLEDFYKQISSPLLSNVTFKYVDNVKNVTRRHFPILFGGGELYTTGIIADPSFSPPSVEGWGIHGPILLRPKVYQAAGSLERLWAYLTVKQLLEQREVAEDKKGPTAEALRLALKYSFVTDVSSLVVVKPNATSAVSTEDAAKPRPFGFGGPAIPLSGGAHFQYAALPGPPPPQGGFGGAALIPRSGGVHARLKGRRGGIQFLRSGATGPGLRFMSRPSSSVSYSLASSGYMPGSMPYSGGGYSNLASSASSFHRVPLHEPIAPFLGCRGGTQRCGPVPAPSSFASAQVESAEDLLSIRLEEEGSPVVWTTVDSADEIISTRLDEDDGSPILLTTARPIPFTTPYSTTTYSSTSQLVDAEATIENPADSFPNIPWLKNTINSNGTITLDSGTYSLGIGETVSVIQPCQNSVNSTAGTCTLLKQCPQIHLELIDLPTYKKHFCEIQSFAGVCCPTPLP